MRILVILSPTGKWGTKTEYTELRKFLISDGYLRIAPEVFMRIVQNRKATEKHYRRLATHSPHTGTVRVLRLTEKQYVSMQMLLNDGSKMVHRSTFQMLRSCSTWILIWPRISASCAIGYRNIYCVPFYLGYCCFIIIGVPHARLSLTAFYTRSCNRANSFGELIASAMIFKDSTRYSGSIRIMNRRRFYRSGIIVPFLGDSIQWSPRLGH
jgi:CRISPR-associated protein Cas2